MKKSESKNVGVVVIIFVFLFIIMPMVVSVFNMIYNFDNDESRYFRILSTTENKDIEPLLMKYAMDNKIDITIDYAGNLDIIDKINMGEEYDAIWVSNSMWYYMLNNPNIVKNPKSISINPVVFGIKKSTALSLGFVGKDIYTKDILKAIKEGKLEFVMTSPVRTNTGATAYLGFLSTILGNPEVITKQMLTSENLKKDIVDLLGGVTRVSGSDEFLEDMFLNGEYQSVVSYETSLISINKKLENANKEPLYLVYPIDGVALNDSSFGFIGTDEKLENFKKIQQYMLSLEFQNELVKTGRRVWYGGVNDNAPKDVFKSEWGIDTTKYLTAVRFPSKDIIKEALALYQSEFRKPSHTVFLLDYSGSMAGSGRAELIEAMNFILTEEEAKQNLVQFSYKDKITVIPFDSDVMDIWTTSSGTNTSSLLGKIILKQVGGSTNLYDTSARALDILSKEDSSIYNLSVVLMTDGESNVGYFSSLEKKYNSLTTKIPIYSIMFGLSNETQLLDIADLTNGKVFDGKSSLLEAFKEVRGYN